MSRPEDPANRIRIHAEFDSPASSTGNTDEPKKRDDTDVRVLRLPGTGETALRPLLPIPGVLHQLSCSSSTHAAAEAS